MPSAAGIPDGHQWARWETLGVPLSRRGVGERSQRDSPGSARGNEVFPGVGNACLCAELTALPGPLRSSLRLPGAIPPFGILCSGSFPARRVETGSERSGGEKFPAWNVRVGLGLGSSNALPFGKAVPQSVPSPAPPQPSLCLSFSVSSGGDACQWGALVDLGWRCGVWGSSPKQPFGVQFAAMQSH